MRFPRMTLWLVVSLWLALVIWLLAPQQLPVSAYKLSLITMAAWVGYWVDRGLFPYARPDRFQRLLVESTLTVHEQAMAVALSAAMLRRALVIAAAMIGVALGA
jgi:hypothetical protein